MKILNNESSKFRCWLWIVKFRCWVWVLKISLFAAVFCRLLDVGSVLPDWHKEKGVGKISVELCRYQVVELRVLLSPRGVEFSRVLSLLSAKEWWFWSWFPWWEKHLIGFLFIYGSTERTKGVSAMSWWYSGLRCCVSCVMKSRIDSCLNHVVGYVLIQKAAVISNWETEKNNCSIVAVRNLVFTHRVTGCR